ncbi:MAG: sulfite exporter TauE/SafE family protein [Epsilonproteobacteria bacterium]|nr:sulfite exporter TauE/SafE family protein [Campylobacterota bacterium]
MEWDIFSFVVINVVIIISSILQMATGVSVGMIIVPFLAMISYTLVPVPIVLASLALTVMMAYKGREHIDRDNIYHVSFGMLAGIFVAVFLFSKIDFAYLGLVFGVLILLSVFISIKIKSFRLSKEMNFAGGLVAGTMGAMAAVGGQVLALLFQNHPLESIKSTLAALYTLFSVVMLLIFYLFGQFSSDQMISGLYMMPGFIIGYLIAPRFTKYFDPKYSKTAVLTMAVVGSLILIYRTLSEMDFVV